MKKLENFTNCLQDLKTADFEQTNHDVIYRMGIIGQFNLTFELAWKALQATLRVHGVESAGTGSPREILQLGYKTGFIDDQNAWLLMLKKRNVIVHIYNEDDADEMLLLIRDSFIPAFEKLEKTLYEKIKEIEDDLP
ncbi:MAG: HI0074 family nucleotidyltransferase substrate-binding subunit [Lachnospiraceae bacterium]|nr:HI0074 family nucleotidyltransferase substrate-binding subunit [Lachnospiraceae bacterium]